jgi:dihydroorotase
MYIHKSNQQVIIRVPNDLHLHLRDGEVMYAVLPDTAKKFGKALIMPNLKPPITNAAQASQYKIRILDALVMQGFTEDSFEPLMTIYLTDNTSVEDIRIAKESGIVFAAKLYPANATTNSDQGVTDIKKLEPIFKEMERVGLVLCVHGETLVSKIFGDKTRGG